MEWNTVRYIYEKIFNVTLCFLIDIEYALGTLI